MDLEKKYAKYTEHQLLEVIEKRDDFTPYAVELAYNELQKRKLSRRMVEGYVETRREKKRIDYYKEDFLALPTYKKFLFLLIVLPYVVHFFTFDYKFKGELLKLNQGKYYSFMGFILFAIGSFSGAFIKVEWLSYSYFFTVFLVCFLAAKRYEEKGLSIILEK